MKRVAKIKTEKKEAAKGKVQFYDNQGHTLRDTPWVGGVQGREKELFTTLRLSASLGSRVKEEEEDGSGGGGGGASESTRPSR
jgi:hypothetical protein